MYVNLPKPSFPYFYMNLFETWRVAYNNLVIYCSLDLFHILKSGNSCDFSQKVIPNV